MRALALGLMAVTGLGCSFVASVPPEVTVRCQNDAECPPGLLCQRITSTCVKTPDETPPGLDGMARISIAKSSRNLATAPDALGPDSTAVLTFRTTEPVSLPVVTACPELLTCVQVKAIAETFTFECRFTASPPPRVERRCNVNIALEDAVGFRSSVTLAESLALDTIEPPPPPVDTPDAVVLRRLPWGADRTQGRARFSIELATASPDVALIAWERGDDSAAPLALGVFGATELVLPNVDVVQVDVASFDRAGNVSPRRRVRDATVVATISEANSDRRSPHRFDERGAESMALLRPDVNTLSSSDALARRGGGAVTTSGAWVWHRRFNHYMPPPYRVATSYDEARARVVTYGGSTFPDGDGGSGPRSVTSEWNGENWIPVETEDLENDGNPPPLWGAAMAFDRALEESILFGGQPQRALSASNATWLWNGKRWKSVTPALSPPPRFDHALVYDPLRKFSVLYGGRGSDGALLADTWLFNGTSWVEARPAHSPGPRALVGAVYDPVRRLVVVQGGDATAPDAGWKVVADAWGFDGTDWVALPALNAPYPAAAHVFQFNAEMNVFHVIGGVVQDGGWLGNRYTLNAPDGGWTAGGWEGYRGLSGQTYDVARGETLFWGGVLPFSFLAGLANVETRVLKGGVTRSAYHLNFTSPSPRVNHSMAYNEGTGQVWMTGGELGPYQYDETWIWDGVGWLEPPSNSNGFSFGIRTYASLAWDPSRQAMVMYGGVGEPQVAVDGGAACAGNNDGGLFITRCASVDAGTWVYNAGLWERQPITSPTIRLTHAMTYDPDRGALMCVGGTSLVPDSTGYAALAYPPIGFREVWHLSVDAGWTRDADDLPLFASGAAIAYDERRRTHVVLPGRSDYLTQRAVMERRPDAGWTVVSPPTGPPLLQVQNLVYDTDRKAVLSYGPPLQAIDQFSADRLWQWDGERWTEAAVSDAEGLGTPGRRVGFRVAYDKKRARAVMFGGTTSDLFELESAQRRPSQRFGISVAGMRIPVEGAVDEVSVTLHSGGQSFLKQPDAGWVKKDGVELAIWRRGTWSPPLASSTADPVTLSALTAVIQGSELPDLLTGEGILNVSVAPLGRNGDGTAVLSTDYVEATLHYRLPP